MIEIITSASFFVIIIAASYTLKKFNFLSKKDGQSLSKIILNITLPCAVVSSFGKIEFIPSLLIIALISFFFNSVLLLLGYLVSKNKSNEEKIYYMISTPGQNIGNFTVPFASAFLGPIGIISGWIFDIGNAIHCVGLDYSITKRIIDKERSSILKMILSIFKIPTFVVYISVLIILLLDFKIPSIIIDFASLIAPANAPLAMIMIGLFLDLSFSKDKIKKISILLIMRYIIATIFALFVYFFLPVDSEIKMAITLVLFSPIASAAPSFTMKFKEGNLELAALANSVSILISIVLLPLLAIILI